MVEKQRAAVGTFFRNFFQDRSLQNLFFPLHFLALFTFLNFLYSLMLERGK